MNACNATLTTATVTPCPKHSHRCPNPHYVSEHHVELHTLKCAWDDGGHNDGPHSPGVDHFDSDGVCWSDDTPGATPHTPVSTVTDAEFKAAVSAFNAHLDVHRGAYNAALDGALVAAFAVRAAQEGDR